MSGGYIGCRPAVKTCSIWIHLYDLVSRVFFVSLASTIGASNPPTLHLVNDIKALSKKDPPKDPPKVEGPSEIEVKNGN